MMISERPLSIVRALRHKTLQLARGPHQPFVILNLVGGCFVVAVAPNPKTAAEVPKCRLSSLAIAIKPRLLGRLPPPKEFSELLPPHPGPALRNDAEVAAKGAGADHGDQDRATITTSSKRVIYKFEDRLVRRSKVVRQVREKTNIERFDDLFRSGQHCGLLDL